MQLLQNTNGWSCVDIRVDLLPIFFKKFQNFLETDFDIDVFLKTVMVSNRCGCTVPVSGWSSFSV